MMVHVRLLHCSLLLAGVALAASTVATATELGVEKVDTVDLRPVDVRDQRSLGPVVTRLDDVQNGVIYAAKKTELIPIERLTANISTNNARQAFSGVAGLNIFENDAAGVQLAIGGRGLSPDRTLNFTVRQNGYDIAADPLGYPEAYYTPPFEALERIEIVRGSGALRYGTQFGGMVNFVFKQPDRSMLLDGSARLTAGSYGFYSGFATLNGGTTDVSYQAFGQVKHSDGWRPNSVIDQATFYGTVRIDVSERLILTADYTHMSYLAQQPGGLTDSMFNADPSVSIRSRNWFDVDWNLASLRLDYAMDVNTSIRSLFFGNFSRRQSVGSLERIDRPDTGGVRTVADGHYNNIGNETTITQDIALFDNVSSIVGGVRVFYGENNQAQGVGTAGSDADFTFVDVTTNAGSDYVTPNFNIAAFTEAKLDLGSGFVLVPGIRFEHIVSSAEGWYRTNGTTYNEDYSRSRSFLIGGLGISWKATSELELYGNAVQNYRAIFSPDLRVTNPSLVIDPNLSDSRGYTLDLGTRGRWLDAVTYDVSGFYVRQNDRLGDLVQGQTIFRTNVADAYTTGVEGVIDVDIVRLMSEPNAPSQFGLHMMVNGSVIEGEYMSTENPAINGKHVEYVPGYTVRASLMARWKGLALSILSSWVDEQFSDATNTEFTANATAGIIPSYNVWDLSASYTIDWFRAEVSCNNVLDERYFTRRARGFPGPGIIPAEPRSVFLTIQMNGDIITGGR
ncbi:MAG: TonB-dependent receptor [Ignavibacteriae bacterium]|nr:MAG: TonB-dependent receptor [Ignavibacteriota bacterium]